MSYRQPWCSRKRRSSFGWRWKRAVARRPVSCLLAVGITAIALGGCRSAARDDASAGEFASRVPPAAALSVETRDWAAAGGGREVVVPASAARVPVEPVATDAVGVALSSAADRAARSPLVAVEAAGVALGTLLAALARDAGIELAAHALPAGRITLALEPRPLAEVLARLADQVPFHWRLADGRLVVRGNVAYTDSYAVDYLNLDRTTHGSVGLATRVGSLDAGSAGSVGGGIANSSETLVESVSEHRFWESLARDVVELVGRGDGAVESMADAVGARFSINRDAGLVTLVARPAVHARLARYLETLQTSARRQVLIEATVLEVALSDSFEAGIDWRLLASGLTGVSAAQVLGGQPLVDATSAGRIVPPAGLVSLVQRSGDGELAATLSLLETFGDVRILSRPRIIALNNQSAVLKVVDNRVYFTARVERRIVEDGDDEVVTGTDIHTVPVGLVMNVTPFIDASDTIMLNVRPTLSRILGFVDDPNPELALAGIRNGVPEIQVREMESVLRVASGDVAIIGGLMQESVSDGERRLPGLSRLPFAGKLFSRRSRERARTELLIVLRPTVMAPVRIAAGAVGGDE